MRRASVVAMVSLALLVIPGVARADSVFFASASDGTSQTSSSGASSSGLVTVPWTPDDSGITRQESALANSGGLRGSARVTANVLRPAGGPGFNQSASAVARWTFDDWVISGPGTQTSGSINLTLDGTFGTGIINLTNLFSAILTSSIGVSVTGNAAGTAFAGSFEQSHSLSAGLFASGGCNPCETTSASASGIIGQGPLPANLVTPVLILPVNTPFSFVLELVVSAAAIYQFGGSSCDGSGCSSAFNIDSLSDFSHTLSLPTSGPVLNLPDGFTLDSGQASIVNNRFSAPTAVPEPDAVLLLVCGLATLGSLARSVVWRSMAAARRSASARMAAFRPTTMASP